MFKVVDRKIAQIRRGVVDLPYWVVAVPIMGAARATASDKAGSSRSQRLSKALEVQAVRRI
jgi:hypothetical protein